MKPAGVLLLIGLHAHAAQLAETFSTTTQKSAGTAIWNTALGAIHPSLYVTGYTGGVTPNVAMNIGDGRDGAFVRSRYAEFSQNGDLSGNIIRLSSSELNVTYFELEDGWFLEPVNNTALTIRSLTDVKIIGQIWCHGRNGSPDDGAGGGGAGGAGRCGGAAGGDGGDTGQPGQDGLDSTAPVTGGAGGSANGAGAGQDGGGGGAWNDNNLSLPENAPGFTNPTGGQDPGERGAVFNDPEFDDVVAGGAGGGGGGAGSTAAGGGGGGGGGVVIIHAGRNVDLGWASDPMDGFIYASGGSGGNSTGNGGDGAGGGGGSVQIFAAGTLTIHNNSGVGASQAVGGTGTARGGAGRNWLTGTSYVATGGFYDPLENSPVVPGDYVKYSTDPEYIETKSYDLGNTRSEVTAVTMSPASADFTLQWRGSNDDFASDDTGWSTNLAVLSQKRFIKFRFTIDSSSATAPTMLDSITLEYTPGRITRFEFESAAGCGRVSGSGGASTRSATWLLLLGAAGLLWRLRRRRKRNPAV